MVGLVINILLDEHIVSLVKLHFTSKMEDLSFSENLVKFCQTMYCICQDYVSSLVTEDNRSNLKYSFIITLYFI